ncbi:MULTISPECIES: LssY C-terminal domain-containing protein [Caballeronia]|uniref:Membrane protein n=1 Tax=Caballeronia zhejiangensis TaxID=871203 RepID=A0A656QAK8_9BURK|nr:MULTISPECIES: LssY C-terminal domain-containing protein [Caballeronia]EKS72076.1 DedA family protein [Burkholderia sp. SJ98]KDR26193.1 membrane protein [Caballeronia zhejiangensis]
MSIHALLLSFGERPHLVLAVVFAAACTESIAAIGTFVPAGVVMFAAGALIGAGAVDGWLTIGVATLGAIAGDGLSYELGRRYHTQVGAWSRSHGHEAAWLRGEQFVARHGGKSIVFARFFAPVRAIVPLVVGTARMARAKFYPINVVSALAWAPTHIAPGILFGASASLAEAVSARLAAIFVILALLLWLIVRLVRLMVERGLPMTKRVAARVTRHWARRLPWLGTQLRKIVDLDSPEFPTLAALVLLFIGSVWLFGGVLQDVVANDPLMRADTALYAFLQSLHIAPIDSLMTGLSALNDRSVVYAVSAVVLVWLIWKRSWKSAVWWIVVVGVGVVLSPFLGFNFKSTRPVDWIPGTPHTPLPDGRAAFSLLIFAFAGWLLCRQQTLRWRAGVATAVALWIVIGSIADLYLGRAWLSGLLGGWALGLAWLSLFAGTYTSWHVDDDVSPKAMALLITGTLAVAGAGYISGHTQPVKASGSPIARLALSLSIGQWLDNGWQLLPARRMEIGGDEEEPLPLQWAASNDAIISALKQAGWQPAVAWTARSALGWLLSQPQVDRLPVLPKYSAGEPSQLALVRTDPDSSRSRLVLRLWRSHFIIRDASDRAPLWYGALYRETLYRPAHVVTIEETKNVVDPSIIIALLGLRRQTVMRSTTVDRVVRDVVLVPPESTR